ncbi:MAG: tail fiber domain-containing protein [Candidatus Omnitrophica bacterium]|nr:tail fiber domain-containing protein [Candidatus Omnitrophota bacterium]
MHKSIKLAAVFVFIFCLFLSGTALSQQEQMTITTYYPSPYGDYDELTTHNNTYLATDTGNVGIGTATPPSSYKLDIQGGSVRIGNSAANAWNMYGFNTQGNINWQLGSWANDHGGFALGQADGTRMVRILASGDSYFNGGSFGIGTSSPDRALSVIGIVRAANDTAETEYTEIGHSGSNSYINAVGDGRLDFRHDGSTLMVLQSNGYVGILDPTPEYELDVNGTIRCYGLILCSSEECKKDIVAFSPSDYEDVLSKMKALNVYRFRYKDETENIIPHTGLIAEHSPKELLSPSGKEIDVANTLGFLIASVKEEQRMIEKQQGQIKNQQIQINVFEARVLELEQRLSNLEEKEEIYP